MNVYIEDKQGEFTRVNDFFKKEIANIRTGRANPSILDNVFVEAYGSKSPINTVANINVADGNSIVVAPWDKSVVKDLEKSLVDADLGLSIVNEGELIRLKANPLTEENRLELVKKLNEKYENARIDLRQVREQIKTAIEKAFADKEMSEDDKFRFMKELDEEISKHNEGLKVIRDVKEKDVMTI